MGETLTVGGGHIRDVSSEAAATGAVARNGLDPSQPVQWNTAGDYFYQYDSPTSSNPPKEFNDPELRAKLKQEDEKRKRPPPTTANPHPPELIPDTKDAIAVCTSPDVCRSPTKPIPYMVHGKGSDDWNYSPNVRSNGLIIKRRDSRFTRTYGDKPGVGLGVESNTVEDVVTPVTSSPIVRANGIPVQRHDDRCTLNNGNCPGEYVHVKSTETHPAPDGKDEQDKSAWQNFKDQVYDKSGTIQTADGIWDKTKEYWNDPSQIGRDAQSAYESLPTAEEAWGTVKDVGSGVSQKAQDVWNDPVGQAEAAGGWAKDKAVGAWDETKRVYNEGGVPAVAGAAVGTAVDVVNPGKKLKMAKEVGEGLEAVGDAAKAKRRLDKAKQAAEESGKDGARSTRKKSAREKYLGRTPGKKSKTGREVRDRMREDGELRTDPKTGKDMFKADDGNWYPVDTPDTHMGHHPTDAVDYWNDEGRFTGAKSPEVRDWMKDSDNYRFEYGPENSARGGSTPSRYKPPAK